MFIHYYARNFHYFSLQYFIFIKVIFKINSFELPLKMKFGKISLKWIANKYEYKKEIWIFPGILVIKLRFFWKLTIIYYRSCNHHGICWIQLIWTFVFHWYQYTNNHSHWKKENHFVNSYNLLAISNIRVYSNTISFSGTKIVLKLWLKQKLFVSVNASVNNIEEKLNISRIIFINDGTFEYNSAQAITLRVTKL